MSKLKITILHIFLLFCFVMAQSQEVPNPAVQKSNVHFYSGGLLVKAWLFLPAGKPLQKWPAIIMAPGFSGTKECNYQFIAADFADSGFAVLLFDYPNFGESEANIKGEADPWQQIQSYRDAISFMETMHTIDSNRIGLWGGSYSGGHVLVVAAQDARVKCIVAMTPFISGSFYVKHMDDETRQFLSSQFKLDRLNRLLGKRPMTIPVVSEDKNDFVAVPGLHAWQFIQSVSAYAPHYHNRITLKSLEMQLNYEPGYYIKDIGAIPKLFIMMNQDEHIPESLMLEAFQKANEPKKLERIEGHHFSPYMEKRKEATAMGIAWFKQYLD